jgi:hypothetical protein
VTLDQLTGIDGAGPLLARFGHIPTTTVQRLGCDAVLTRILTDPAGQVVDVGRASRHTTTAQNTALTVMHTTCTYPTCDTPLARCDIHHATWWSHGGPTNLNTSSPSAKPTTGSSTNTATPSPPTATPTGTPHTDPTDGASPPPTADPSPTTPPPSPPPCTNSASP